MESPETYALPAKGCTIFLGQGLYIFENSFPWQHAKGFNNAEGDAPRDALQGFVLLQFEQGFEKGRDMAVNEFLQSGLHVLAGLSVQEIAGKHLGNWLQQTFACFNKSDYLVVPNNIAVTGEFEIGIGGSCCGIGAGLNFGADGLHRCCL